MTHMTSKPFVFLVALALLWLALVFADIAAFACDDHEHKPVTCTSTTSSFSGQTRTVCR